MYTMYVRGSGGGGGGGKDKQVKGLRYNPFFWKIAHEHRCDNVHASNIFYRMFTRIPNTG